MRINSKRVFVFMGILLAALASRPAESCSTFVLADGRRIVFGKNYDWNIGSGILVVNQKGLAKVSTADAGGNPARWTSRYGSVTFNQYGRGFPMGGMNEAGLVIELMWLEGSVYPEVDERATLDNLQWIQYQLDTATTVDEVLASDERVRIVGEAPLHYLVADAAGNAATVEFLNGRLVAHTGTALPVAALTNSTYASSLRYRQNWPQGFGSTSSNDRFAAAASACEAFASVAPVDAVGYAFDTLADVAQPNFTQWSIVYEVIERRLHFRTDRCPAIRSLDLNELSFSCTSTAQVLNLATRVAGDIADALEPYSLELNRSLIEYAFRNTPFLEETSQGALNEIAHFPDTTSCVGLQRVRRATGRRTP
jgi:choloylglycine hydrolase